MHDQVAGVPDPGAQAEGRPGAEDEDGYLERHERQHAEELPDQQGPARDGLGQQHGRGPRPKELRQEAAGPQQQEQHADGPADEEGQQDLQHPDGRFRVAPLFDADGAEAEEITPRPALRPVNGCRSAPNSSISPAGRTAVAPSTETLRQSRMHSPLRPRSSQKPREASDWRTVSRIMQRTTRMAAGEFMAPFPWGRGENVVPSIAHGNKASRVA